MKRVMALVVVALGLAVAGPVQAAGPAAQPKSDEADLTRLLNEFLAGASRDDSTAHKRFWAEDLIYTGSSGRRVSKADILRDLRSAPPPKPEDPKTTYTAEDVRIHLYGNAAVVAFRLIGTTVTNEKTQIGRYLNTGTFLKRDGRWQAVAWQATRMPRVEEEARAEVASVEAAFERALLASDTKSLAALTDTSFVWTRHGGEQVPQRGLLDELSTGRLKYSKLETDSVTISVQGDAAIVRGGSMRQRSAVSGSKGDPEPGASHYTLVFVNKGGDWKAVAMQSSR